jgi:eukaryotic-like serine/threonine-protein kinase
MPGMNHRERALMAGRYRVTDRLGSGGMARVHLATDEVLGRQVALKVLPTDSPDEALARFRREARVGASLNHPNVVAIWDSAASEDSLLIAMEYVEGETLRHRIERGPLSPGEALPILEQIASALDHLHSAGLVHRDVKPSNILVRPDGIAKLADLGIAAGTDLTELTATGSVLGTLRYLSPERIQGGPAEAPSDIYALAVTAYEALAGRQPYEASTPAALLTEIERGDLDLRAGLAGAPPAVARVLERGVDKDPAGRPSSAGTFVADLRAAYEQGDGTDPTAVLAAPPLPPTEPLEAEAAAAQPPPPPPLAPYHRDRPPFATPERRRTSSRLPAVLAVGALVALVAVLAISALGGDDSESPTRAGGGDGGGKQQGPAKDATTEQQQQPTEGTKEATPSETPVSASEAAALNDEGYALIQAGDPASAIPLLERAVDGLEPGTLTYGYALFNLANAYRLAGRPEEAIPLLEERLKIPDQLGEVRAELALARQEAGVGSGGGGGAEGGEGDD